MKAIMAAGLAAAAMILPSSAGARDDAKVLMTDHPEGLKFEKQWGFCDVIITGDTLYLSGVVAMTRDGDPNLEAAYARAFEQITGILKKAGASWDDVVDITSFHTDVTAQMPAIVAVKNKYVRAPFPAWTAIQVARLIPEKGITEIKIVAKLPSRVRPLNQ